MDITMNSATLPLPPATTTTAAAAVVLDDELETQRFTRSLPDAQGQPLAESALRISGMHCAACAGTVEKALMAVPGVTRAQVSAASQAATVQWRPALTRPSALVAAIEAAGYGAVPDTAAATRVARRQESRQALWRLFVAVFCAMQVMMMAAPAYFSGSGELTLDMSRLMNWGGWLLTLPVMLFSAAPFFTGAWRALRTRHIGMDVPVAMGLLVAFVASTAAAFAPGSVLGNEVYFDSITMFVSFLLIGRYLEMRARHKSEAALEDTVGRMPETALREAPDGSVSPISVQRVQRGDVLRVPLGQAFCADGVLTLGSTSADESLLTGESTPVVKKLGDKVVAGSLNLGAPVSMRVQGVGADTRYEAIVALMRQARSQRPVAVMGADKWAAPFLWAVLGLAVLAAVAWSFIDPTRVVTVAVAVLIVTCPCALSLAAPSALLSASSLMAKQGVLLRRIDAALGLAQMQVLFIDKTGTLTEAQNQKLVMSREATPSQFSDAHLQHVASSLAAWSSHPLAKVIAQTGGPQIVWHDLQELPGQGLQGRDEQGALWCLGKGMAAAPTGKDSEELQTWLSRDGQTLASFHFAEVLRPGVAPAVLALQQDGVQVALLSGDSPGRVQHVAQLLGLSDARGGMSPHDKLAAVRAAQARRQRVAMIGDGINDAPVLAQADVSLAMAAGAQIARTQADGVLLSNALGDVVRARALGKQTLRVIHQNFLWAGLYNAACVPLALLGYLPPWAAGLGMAVSSLVVVGNSMRLGASRVNAER
jgi:P-type Cu2+ transporter